MRIYYHLKHKHMLQVVDDRDKYEEGSVRHTENRTIRIIRMNSIQKLTLDAICR